MHRLKPLLLLIISCILTSCAAKAPLIYIPQKEPSTRYLSRIHPEVILVLGSGSSRGFAHAGVLAVLEKNHIPIDMIVGTSAGSIVGALYADNPSAAHLEKILLNTTREEVIDYSLMNIGYGIISGNQLQRFLLKNMRATYFQQLRIPFVAVSTDLASGQMHVFASGPIAPAVNASSAAPPYFRPVNLYGRTWIDGGLVDPVAVDVAKRFHPKIIIAVSLNHRLANETPLSSPRVFLRGVDIMLGQLNYYTAADADIIIQPRRDDISMFDGTKRSDFILAGAAAANQAMPRIKALMAKHGIKPAY